MPRKKTRVTGYLEDDLVEDVEEFAEEKGISRSKAVRQLVEAGLADSSWDAKVAEAIRSLTAPQAVAFTLSVTTESGDTITHTKARQPGYAADDALPVDPVSQAQYLTVVSMLEMLADQNDQAVKQFTEDVAERAELQQGRGGLITELDGEE